jgi:hypothetical protein
MREISEREEANMKDLDLESDDFQAGYKRGRRSLVADAVKFAMAAFLAFATTIVTYRVGVKQGVTLAISTDYIGNAFEMGYNVGRATDEGK